jgi:hypothetical protein
MRNPFYHVKLTYQRIPRIITRLRHQQNLPTRIILQSHSLRNISSPIAIEDVRGAGDMFEMVVVKDAEAHCERSGRTERT